jgi:hypothetical protein
MDAVETVKTAFGGAHMWFAGTAGDITEEQANHVPEGCAQPIGELMAHILHCEDGMICQFLLKKPPLWERDGWGAKTGLPLMIDLPAAGSPRTRCDPAALRDYGQQVFAQTDAYLASLTQGDLDQEVDLTAAGLGKMSTAAFLLTMLLGNTYAHTGEISAIKGLMGSKGYPF